MTTQANRIINTVQRDVLERGATGVCIRYEWTWLLGGKPVTRQVNDLLKRGLVVASCYRGGIAAISPSEAGRAILARQ